MFDTQKYISDNIKDILNVELEYPTNVDLFPVAIVKEVFSNSEYFYEEQEAYTDVGIEIEIVTKSDNGWILQTLSSAVDARMIALGFKRTGGTFSDNVNEKYKRKVLRYQALISETLNIISRR